MGVRSGLKFYYFKVSTSLSFIRGPIFSFWSSFKVGGLKFSRYFIILLSGMFCEV